MQSITEYRFPTLFKTARQFVLLSLQPSRVYNHIPDSVNICYLRCHTLIPVRRILTLHVSDTALPSYLNVTAPMHLDVVLGDNKISRHDDIEPITFYYIKLAGNTYTLEREGHQLHFK